MQARRRQEGAAAVEADTAAMLHVINSLLVLDEGGAVTVDGSSAAAMLPEATDDGEHFDTRAVQVYLIGAIQQMIIETARLRADVVAIQQVVFEVV